MAKNPDVAIKITADASDAQKDIKATGAALDQMDATAKGAGSGAKSLDQIGESAKRTKAGAEGAADAFGQLNGAMAALGVAALLREFVQLNGKIESQRNALTALTGSSETAAASMDYVRGVADRLGGSAVDLTQEYISLAAATKGTSLEGDATRSVFESIVGSMAKLGKSSAETSRALQAVSQMASKGVVSAEEMRQQLGEALPGAMQALSKATGISVADLNKMMESGQLLASEMLPALSKGLDEAFGLDKTAKVETMTASVGRLENAWTRFMTNRGDLMVREALDVTSSALGRLDAGMTKASADWVALAQYIDGSIPSWDALQAALDGNRAAFDATVSGANAAAEANKAAAEAASGVAKAIADLSGPALNAQNAYTKQTEATKQAVEATKASGEANVAAAKTASDLASAIGNVTQALQARQALEQAEATAAQATAQAATNQLNLNLQRIAQIKEQIAALQGLNAATDAERAQVAKAIADKQLQLDAVNKLLPQQEAEVQKLGAMAQAQAEQARQAQVATQTFGDQSARMSELSLSADAARMAVDNLNLRIRAGQQAAQDLAMAEGALKEAQDELTAAHELGSGGMEQLTANVAAAQATVDGLNQTVADGQAAQGAMTAATSGLASANERLADAVRDAVQALDDQLSLSRGQLDIDNAALDLKQIEVQRRLEVARARGNERAVQREQINLMALEIERIKAAAAAKEREAGIIRKKIELAHMEAQADGQVTEQEQRQIAIMNQKLAIIDAEKAAFDASAQAKLDVVRATEAATAAERQHGAEADKTTSALRGQAAAAETAKKAETTSYTLSDYQMERAKWQQQQPKFSGQAEDYMAYTVALNEQFNAYWKELEWKRQYEASKAQEEFNAAMERKYGTKQPDPRSQAETLKTVRIELPSLSGGGNKSINVQPGDENTLEAWLRSLETGRSTYQ